MQQFGQLPLCTSIWKLFILVVLNYEGDMSGEERNYSGTTWHSKGIYSTRWQDCCNCWLGSQVSNVMFVNWVASFSLDERWAVLHMHLLCVPERRYTMSVKDSEWSRESHWRDEYLSVFSIVWFMVEYFYDLIAISSAPS